MLDIYTGTSTYVGGALRAIAEEGETPVPIDLCTMTGADMTQYSIVGLKSMNHFRGFFTNHSDAIVTADTPGMRPSNLRLNFYQQVLRPIFPLDDDVTYDGTWPK